MKKILFLLTAFFFGISFSVLAEEIECPFSEFEYETNEGEVKTLSDTKDCQSDGYENILSGVFLNQRKILNEKINSIYKDNSNHPNILSKKLTKELKISRQCFERICEEITNVCKEGNASYQSEIKKAKECGEKINIFFQLHLLEGNTALQKNSERKQRSVFREKFRQIEGKIRQYFVRLSIFLYNRLTDFDGKFTNFTAQPS